MKKKLYRQPELTITTIHFTNYLLTGSPFIINKDAGSSDDEYYNDNLSMFLEPLEDFSDPYDAPQSFEV